MYKHLIKMKGKKKDIHVAETNVSVISKLISHTT